MLLALALMHLKLFSPYCVDPPEIPFEDNRHLSPTSEHQMIAVILQFFINPYLFTMIRFFAESEERREVAKFRLFCFYLTQHRDYLISVVRLTLDTFAQPIKE
jgi:hypothetical protein